jgi:hypothetical protein
MTRTDPTRGTQKDYAPSRKWRPGQNVVPTSSIAEVAAASRSITMHSPDDAEHEALTAPEPPSGAEAYRGELDALRRRIDALEAAHNAAAWEINEHNKFLHLFRMAFGAMLHYPWYRFIIWLWPMPLPPFKEGKVVPYIVRADRRPVVGLSDGRSE